MGSAFWNCDCCTPRFCCCLGCSPDDTAPNYLLLTITGATMEPGLFECDQCPDISGEYLLTIAPYSGVANCRWLSELLPGVGKSSGPDTCCDRTWRWQVETNEFGQMFVSTIGTGSTSSGAPVHSFAAPDPALDCSIPREHSGSMAVQTAWCILGGGGPVCNITSLRVESIEL